MSKGKLPHTDEEPTTVGGWNRAMRRYADIVQAVDADISKEIAELLRHYADGVEKAHKREIDRLRAALERCADVATQVRMPIGGVADSSRCGEIAKTARDALSAPALRGAKCIDGLRGHPDCRGCDEHCLDVRKRNCFYWIPGIGKCALDGKPSCRIACGNFRVSKEEKPGPAEGCAE